MKKKRILNICMAAAILLAVIVAIVAVGYVKGWFGGKEIPSDLTISEKTGIVMMERSGVSYEVKDDTTLEAGDKVYTEANAALSIAKEGNACIYVGANEEVRIVDVGDEMKFEVIKGNSLLDARALERMTVVTGKTEITMNQSVAAISTQTGSSMVYVYAGEIVLGETTVSFGEVVTIVENSEEYKTAPLKATDLSDEQIEQLKKCGMDDTFCFTEEELETVLEEREKERLEAQKEALKKKEKKVEEEKPEEEDNDEAETAVEEDSTSEEEPEEEYVEEECEEPIEDTESDVEEDDTEPEEEYQFCSITIVCDTILDNMENLTPGKEGYVPSNGVILGTSTVEFYEGETVFDVLQRVCDGTGIQLEYAYTPIYESYYIEGINQLYEFDCGPESGWMYQVNGWFPNYGCSSYQLEDGDSIVWCYSCNGLGADVGGSNF